MPFKTPSNDDRNRLDLVKLNGALQADYDYDAASRLTKTTFGNGTEKIRAYDTLNRLKALTSKRGAIELSKYVYSPSAYIKMSFSIRFMCSSVEILKNREVMAKE